MLCFFFTLGGTRLSRLEYKMIAGAVILLMLYSGTVIEL
jgi:hypothetical protein